MADELYEVERIIDYRINLTPGAQRFEYFVHWLNYPDSDNSWEPANNFSEDNDVLREYLRKTFQDGPGEHLTRAPTLTRTRIDKLIQDYPILVEKCYLQPSKSSTKRKAADASEEQLDEKSQSKPPGHAVKIPKIPTSSTSSSTTSKSSTSVSDRPKIPEKRSVTHEKDVSKTSRAKTPPNKEVSTEDGYSVDVDPMNDVLVPVYTESGFSLRFAKESIEDMIADATAFQNLIELRKCRR